MQSMRQAGTEGYRRAASALWGCTLRAMPCLPPISPESDLTNALPVGLAPTNQVRDGYNEGVIIGRHVVAAQNACPNRLLPLSCNTLSPRDSSFA